MRLAAAVLLLASLKPVLTEAQTAPAPLAPPLSSAPAPTPAAPISPILINPALARSPSGRIPAPVAPAQGAAPLDQQKMQAYRNDLVNQQRALEQQGVSPGAEPYRNIQQQLNQLNGAR